MNEFDSFADEASRRARAAHTVSPEIIKATLDRLSDVAEQDDVFARGMPPQLDDSVRYDPSETLPPVTIRASVMYDEKTGVKTSADVEFTTARHLDPDMVRVVVSSLESGSAAEVEP